MPIVIPLAIMALAAMTSKKPVARASLPVAQPAAGASAGPFDLGSASVQRYIRELATAQGLDPAAVIAVIRVESSGKPYGPDGRLLLRFEPHVFAKLTQKAGKRAVVLNPGMADLSNPRKRSGGQAGEYDTLARASKIDPELALRASSFGLPQVMGFNHAALGYGSAREMYDAFGRSPLEQIRGMVAFIASSAPMLAALKAKDWPAFVARYNGAKVGSKNNNAYTAKLRDAYQAAKKGALGMAGFPARAPVGLRLQHVVNQDRRAIVSQRRRAQFRAWMNSAHLPRARQANQNLSATLGWRVKPGALKGPGSGRLAIMLFRVQQVSGMKPTGLLTRQMVSLLQRHQRLNTRVGRWSRAVLSLDNARGMGDAPTPSPAATAKGKKKSKNDGGFFGRLVTAAVDRDKEQKAEKKAERAARTARDAAEAARLQAQAAAFRPPPQSTLMTSRAMPRKKNWLPWIIGGGVAAVALALLATRRPPPPPQVQFIPA